MVHTDVDSCVTWVSGAVELIERVEAEPWLEARRFEGEAIAFPDRREDASPPTSSSQDARRVLGLRPFLRGFAWWVASMVIGSGVLIAAPDALVAVILSLGVFAYGLYRLARGLVGSVGSVPVDRRRD